MSQTLYAYFQETLTFTIPEGIDIRDTKNVCWYVRWGTLIIELKDGSHFEIKPDDDAQFKRPESCELLDERGNEEVVTFNNHFDPESESEDSEKEDSDSSDSE